MKHIFTFFSIAALWVGLAIPVQAQAPTSVTFTYSGSIVTWPVPTGVTSLTVEARGAEGAVGKNSVNSPGKGAIIKGAITVTPGQQLSILVGQNYSDNNYQYPDGGGGSFVVAPGSPGNPTPLVIAGGGGGGGGSSGYDTDTKHGQAGNNGGQGGAGGGNGGTGGSGGNGSGGDGGGGLYGNGTGFSGGRSFVNGGRGNVFGGGGGGVILGFSMTGSSGGGGGGYSGGGGAFADGVNNIGGPGGGGGSFNAGTNPSSLTGTSGNSGNGLVIITYVPCTPLGITQQPVSSSNVNVGANISVPVSVSGSPTTYQWYKNGTPVDGQTSAALTLNNVQLSQAGSYSLVATSSCNSVTTNAFNLAVLSPATIRGMKTVSGNFTPGSTVTYIISLTNTSPYAQLDNPGNELTDVLPNSLSLVSAQANGGVATPDYGTNTATWNGSIAGNGSVTITITATIKSGTSGQTVSNQASISYDADGNATNESSAQTDDPTVAGSTNPTTFVVICLPISVNLGNDGPLTCSKTSVKLTATGGDAGARYTFSSGASQAGGPTSATANVTNSGPYSVTVTNPDGCSSFTTTTVSSNTTAPNASLSNNGPITCAQRTVTLTAGGGGTYVFSNGANQVTGGNTATVTADGSYSVTVTNPVNGCTAVQSTQVTSNTAPPNATLTNNGPLTANQPTVTLNAGGGNTYAFSSGVSQQNGGNTATVTTPGPYQVTVTSSSNGCSATASTIVTGAVSQSSCRNGTAVITVVATGTPGKYEWYRNSISSARLTENPALVRGTSTASLTLVNQQVTADYYVRVTDANGLAVVYGPFRMTVNLGCNVYARVGAEEVELRISLLGNPIQGDQLRATVTGAEGKALNVQLLDLSGRPIRQQQWQQAESDQSIEWNLSGQASGVYLLQATSPVDDTTQVQRHSVKIIKP